MKLLYFMYGIALGLVLGGFAMYYEQSQKQSVPITEQIVLTVPKNNQDAEKQLLYMAASKGMLEEIHRLRVLKDNEQKTRKR